MRQEVSISRPDRLFTYIRDGMQCLRCGSGKDLTIDHVVPLARGGADHWSNYQTLCRSCNAAKYATTVDYRPAASGQLWLNFDPPKAMTDPTIRFMDRVTETPDGCWKWAGSPSFGIDGLTYPARRASYVLFVGDLPQDKWVVLTCGDGDCVAPQHLELVVPGDHSVGSRPQDFCRKGYALTPENSAIDCGVKRCRRCRNDKQRRYVARKRQSQALVG